MKKPAVGMQIFIKGMIRRTIALYVEPGDTIHKVKRRIQGESHIRPHQQRLLFERHRSLEDDRTPTDYNIQAGATLLGQYMPKNMPPTESRKRLRRYI